MVHATVQIFAIRYPGKHGGSDVSAIKNWESVISKVRVDQCSLVVYLKY